MNWWPIIDRKFIHQVVPFKRQALRLHESYDLLLLALAALLLPGLLLLPPWLAVLRIPLGLAMVLIAPGYVLTVALFPYRGDLDGPMRAGLSFGLSIAVAPLMALLLDKLPWGIRPWPIAIFLALWIALLCCAAAWRRGALLHSDTAATPPIINLPGWWHNLNRRVRAGYVLGVLVAVGMLVASLLLLNRPVIPPSEFYILGRSGLAEDYPRAATIGEELTVIMGIVNRESAERDYRVEVWATDSSGATRREVLQTEGSIHLAAGAHLQRPLMWHMHHAGENQQVDILLFSGNDVDPYRRLKLWVDVKDS